MHFSKKSILFEVLTIVSWLEQTYTFIRIGAFNLDIDTLGYT